MPFKGLSNLFGFKKKSPKPKQERVHPYDEVDESKLQPTPQTVVTSSPRRRPREYDEIAIDDVAPGPTVVDSPASKPEQNRLNYIEVEVQPQNPDAEVKRVAPPTAYTTIDVAATAASGERRVSIPN